MSSWILISGGTVIDGTGSPAVEDCPVLVKDETIEAVGAGASEESIPRGDDVVRIDATGKTVMPGLIDAHCHTSFGESRTQEEQDLYTSHELRTLRSAWNVTKVLRAGVTGISDPGGSYFIGVGIREGIAEGLVQGPRMKTAGRFLSTSNGISDWYPSSVGVPDSSIGKVVNTADEMVTEVRHQVKNGVDLIKIGDSVLGDFEAFSRDEVKAMSDAAHRLNKCITMHARGSNNVDSAGGGRTRLDHARQHPAGRHHRAAGRLADPAGARPAAAGQPGRVRRGGRGSGRDPQRLHPPPRRHCGLSQQGPRGRRAHHRRHRHRVLVHPLRRVARPGARAADALCGHDCAGGHQGRPPTTARSCWATRTTSARWRPARAPISSSSTATRSPTSGCCRTSGASRR